MEFLLACMMSTNLIAEYNLEGFTPPRGENAYPSGLQPKDQGHYKYGPASIDDPVLIIVDPIYDKRMNIIPAGYYQLSLDAGREFLYLVQSGNTIAIIPVFKIEIDRQKDEAKRKDQMPSGYFKQKKYIWKKNRAAKKRQRLIKQKKIDPDEHVYSEATIEYSAKDRYYLIKFEKDSVRAWGAIKAR